MKQIKLLAVGLLSMSVLALHLTAPQKYVAFIPAVEENYKVRPAGMDNPVPLVVSLEEADRSYNQHHRPKAKVDETNYHDECWFNNCDLELELKLIKISAVNFFKG